VDWGDWPNRSVAGHDSATAQYDGDNNYQSSCAFDADRDVHGLPDRSGPNFCKLRVRDFVMVELQANEYPEFKGVTAIFEENRAQVVQFCNWAASHDWEQFHRNHYDWWAFPIDKPSSFRFGYTVFDTEQQELRNNREFMRNLEEAARLLLLSWGWDASTNRALPHPEPHQSWANWPIRWSKCTRSMEIFGLKAMHESCIAFGQVLLDQGTSFIYRGRDLALEHGLQR
jgi:hypothetical protein